MSIESDGRAHSAISRLIKLGFSDPHRAAARLTEYPRLLEHAQFLDEIALAADPDAALASTLTWIDAADERTVALWLDDAGLRARWLLVTGASSAFSEFLIKHPREALHLVDGGLWQQSATRSELVARVLQAVGAVWTDGRWLAPADDEATLNALRIAYKREVIAIAARDLSGASALEQVTQDLSYLADAVIEAATAIAWRSVNPQSPKSRFAVIAMGILFLGGVNARMFFLIAAALIAVFGLIIASSPWRRERIFAYLDPWSMEHALGKGYQLSHSLIAIGRGEIFGVGLGGSVEKLHWLPEAHTDFLLAVIGEEFGFVGVVIIIGLFMWLTRRIMYIGRQAIAMDRVFAGLVAQGVGIWMGFQSFINMGVNLGALPTKGLTLPLMSYGGSAILLNLVAIAMVLRVDYENRQLMHGGRL